MKNIFKYIKNIKNYFLFLKRIQSVKFLLKVKFKNISFKFLSFGGADFNYYILKKGEKFAILRLAIEDYKVDKSIVLQRFEKAKRLEKEYQAYSIGSKYDLTPKVLHYCDNGLVCEYIKGSRVYTLLEKDKSQVWNILIDAAYTYQKLHNLNITHLDATLKNFIMDKGKMKIIDFEYYPSKNLNLEVQKAYDYIRIIEHTLRFIPEQYQNGYHEFIDVLDVIVSEELRSVDFILVGQWVKNIETYPIYNILQKRIFKNLVFN
jgi:tRNA A-37 threonylcarbamoyl transferase component Bud32